MIKYESPRERNTLSLSSTCNPVEYLTYLCKCQEESCGEKKDFFMYLMLITSCGEK